MSGNRRKKKKVTGDRPSDKNDAKWDDDSARSARWWRGDGAPAAEICAQDAEGAEQQKG